MVEENSEAHQFKTQVRDIFITFREMLVLLLMIHLIFVSFCKPLHFLGLKYTKICFKIALIGQNSPNWSKQAKMLRFLCLNVHQLEKKYTTAGGGDADYHDLCSYFVK